MVAGLREFINSSKRELCSEVIDHETVKMNRSKERYAIKGVALSLIVMLLLPNAIYVLFETSSLAPGFILASWIVFWLNIKQIRMLHTKTFLWVLAVCCVLMLNSLYIYYIIGDVRTLSAVAFIAVLLTSPLLSSRLAKAEWRELEKSLMLLLHVLAVLGWIGLVYKFLIVGWEQKIKYPFPFSEPSFFAVCYGMFAVGYSFVASRNFGLYMVVNMILFSFLFPSLTFLLFVVIVIVVMIVRLQAIYFCWGVLIAPVVILGVGYYFISDVEYFSSRLSFSGTENITTLVWLQGWDLSYINLNATEWRGLGFQMLGYEGTELSDISYKLEDLTGKFMNITSGGFLAAKIISEFGLVGVMLAILYILFLVCLLIKVGSSSSVSLKSDVTKKIMVLQGLVFGYVVEFFFRGYGYFSPCLYVSLAALMATWHIKSESRDDQRFLPPNEI